MVPQQMIGPREVLVKASLLSDVPGVLSLYRGDQGGVCGDGCNLVFAEPSKHGGTVGMIYEGDRFGGKFRIAGEAAPDVADAVMATNHFLKYGFNPWQPDRNFGSAQIDFSSLWRYESGKRTIEAWGAVTSPSGDMSFSIGQQPSMHLGTERMRELLQRVTEGATA